MTDDAASRLVVALPEDWFADLQRVFENLRFRAERAEKELAQRETDLEMRARDLADRGEQLREAWRSADERSQTLMAREHDLREQLAATAQEREAIAADRANLEARRAELERREARIRDLERQLAAENPPGAGPEEGTVDRLLALHDTMQAAAETLKGRGTDNPPAPDPLELREEANRLQEIRAEIVNAGRALRTVDEALAKMPYEVVDDFTKRSEFDAYERAVRRLRELDPDG